MRQMRVTILGCGSSSGVPKIGHVWGACDPGNPLNRRRRASILVEVGSDRASMTTILVDTSPDLREQLLDAGTQRIDAVLYTHDHADQSHGIDDLRHVAVLMRRRIPVYTDQETGRSLKERFGYCFETPPGGAYPPILDHTVIPPDLPVLTIEGPGGPVDVLPFDQDHGPIRSLGFRFANLAYSSDVVNIPGESFARLEGLECWICDALRYTVHPSHAHLDKTLEWFERTGVPRGILTNMHIDLDYAEVKARVPAHVDPGHDGMVLEFQVP